MTESYTISLPDLPLSRGGVVRGQVAQVWEWGPRHLPAVVLVHALTGSAQAGGEGGWWEPVIGPARVLDPTRYRLIGINLLGSCYGSSAPGADGWPADASLTTADLAQAQWLTLDALGVHTLALVAGGSLGGMTALAMATQQPSRVQRLMPIGAAAQSTAWVIGFNHVQRQILALDSTRGLEVARQLAMLSYRAEPGLDARQGRQTAPRGQRRYNVESYLEYQGVLLRQRFTPASYLALLDAMDSHDLRESLHRYTGPTLVVDIDTDVLFTPAQSDALAALLPSAHRRTIKSAHGHDAFLIEWPQVASLLAFALEM
jgi:homoserine O-acetyltransferase/O-succinyltransferase